MAEETQVCLKSTGRIIPIVMLDRLGKPVWRSTLYFSGGKKGAQEAGTYSFWTVMHGGKALFWVRANKGRTAEDRLNDYSSIPAKLTKLLEHVADSVRPSTEQEIRSWVRGKKEDAPFAQWDTLNALPPAS